VCVGHGAQIAKLFDNYEKKGSPSFFSFLSLAKRSWFLVNKTTPDGNPIDMVQVRAIDMHCYCPEEAKKTGALKNLPATVKVNVVLIAGA